MRGQPRWQQATPQQWGTELHNRLEDYINDADELLELLLSAGFKIYSENSLLGGETIKRDDDGNIIWDDRGKKGTFRPDVIITQRVGGDETIIMILDLKTGRARISRSWKSGLEALIYETGEKMSGVIDAIRPSNPNRASGFVKIEEEDLPWD